MATGWCLGGASLHGCWLVSGWSLIAWLLAGVWVALLHGCWLGDCLWLVELQRCLMKGLVCFNGLWYFTSIHKWCC